MCLTFKAKLGHYLFNPTTKQQYINATVNKGSMDLSVLLSNSGTTKCPQIESALCDPSELENYKGHSALYINKCI